MEKRKLTKGITLIALVVTIVVLLILAGITIALVFGQNGVIKKAQDSKEETAIGEMREKLEMAKVPIYADGNGSYKVEDYWDRIESEGLITDKEVDKIDNGDGTYEVTTTPGYVFEITVEPDEEIADNIIIDYLGKGNSLKIGLRVKNKTTNSIEIEVVRAEGASNFKYSIKKQGEEYGEAQASNATTHTFNGLTQGGIYTIKVEATKNGEQQVVERTVQVGEIPKAIKGTVEWTGKGQAQVRIYTGEDGYQLEWQKNGISEGSWTREAEGVKEKTITGLANGDKIYARLYDGVSSGKYANVEVIDNINPQKATITPSTTAGIKLGESLTATITHIDNESGVNIKSCKWELNASETPLGIEEKNYNNYFTSNSQNITLKPTKMGNNYLHVLTVDNEGNVRETVSMPIVVKAPEINRANVGNIYVQFLDTNNNIVSSVPTPILGEGMTPIKWNESTSKWETTTTTDPGWYSYTEEDKQWANVVIDGTFDASGNLDESAKGYGMFVWIPRYAYKIEYLASDGLTVTGYSDSRGIVDLEGNIVPGTEKQGAISVGDNYVVHPAFKYFEDNKAISGIWVAKFEASSVQGNSNSISGDNVTTKTLQIKPGVTNWGYIEANNMFTVCQNYKTTLNSHMMKNSEWGAVVYLTQSSYGKNEQVWVNNSSSRITGSAGNSAKAAQNVGTTTDYTSSQGQEASTTGRIYGIYDMSGGANEYLAAHIDTSDEYLNRYCENIINAPDYMKDVYISVGSRGGNYFANMGAYGDATFETSVSGDGSKSAWYGDGFSYPVAPNSSALFDRGGASYAAPSDGLYSLGLSGDSRSGSPQFYNGFRPVLISQ